MSRWEPDARGRLELAALALYLERGFEQTTVAQIAERAGLAERTFFRHYADKREVLFGGSAELQTRLVTAVAEAPAEAAPIDAVKVGLDVIGGALQGRFEHARKRHRVIRANPELLERELIKLAALATALAEALEQRGVPQLTANLAAEAGIAAFKIGFNRWISAAKEQDLALLMRDSLDELRAVTAGQ
ncbi:TetR/AcrR family transcriptional regulator [Actinocrinis sp.]|uniref:TetR/AcrR family transcriptional regulator n=1 Tax=Actinocrinis sp. TaxID=1920516 RepID=UPI002B6B5513|nr:TetR family transcriptional regulator [Actinocrinis sp.]HXR72134.1 TetR family transcriptional regulator [Actinocrinis sp.]